MVAERAGEEAVDITENLFVNMCRFATREAVGEARLSMSVFATYWSSEGNRRYPAEVLSRWLPMRMDAPSTQVVLDAAWFWFEVAPNDAGRDVFDRIEAELSTLSAELVAGEQHEFLPRGWDFQVG
jgi:hypothetical protein